MHRDVPKQRCCTNFMSARSPTNSRIAKCGLTIMHLGVYYMWRVCDNSEYPNQGHHLFVPSFLPNPVPLAIHPHTINIAIIDLNLRSFCRPMSFR